MATASKVRYVMFYDMSNVQLAEVHSERDTWRRQQEQKTDERIQLDAQIGLLKEYVISSLSIHFLSWTQSLAYCQSRSLRQ